MSLTYRFRSLNDDMCASWYDNITLENIADCLSWIECLVVTHVYLVR